MPGSCDIYWGTHGCDLDAGHYGVCQCGSRNDPCSQFRITGATSEDGFVPGEKRHALIEGGWSEWYESEGFRSASS